MARHRPLLAASLALIAVATLVPAPGEAWQREFWCLRCSGSYDPVELVLNVLLFVPFGLALRAAGLRATVAAAAIVATTAGIEALQYFVIVGRDGTVRDCLTNAAGGFAGFLILPHAGAMWRADRRPSRGLAWAGALVWIAHAAMASVLFRPTDTSQRYFIQIAPHLGQFDVFPGSVSSAAVDGAVVPDGALDWGFQRQIQATDSITLSGVATQGPLTTGAAPIVAIVDGKTKEMAILAQQRAAALFQARVAAQDVGFHAPGVVLGDVFGHESGATGPVQLAGTRRGYTLRLREISGDAEPREATMTLSPSLGWALWWPFDYPGRATIVWMTAVWLLVPVALIGFWAGSFGPPLVAVIAAQVIVPLALGPGIVSWLHVVTAAAGALAGTALGRLRSAAPDESLGASP